MAMVTYALLVLLLTLACRYYRSRKRKFSYFKDRNIPGPEPNIVFGNFHQIGDQGIATVTHQWAKKYGKLYGYFEGPKPVIVTSDLDILKTIFIKDYNKFAARKRMQLAPHTDDNERVNMFFAEGKKWKRQRCIMTPSFSTTKMKQMTPLINRCIDNLMEVLHERSKNGKPFDIYPYFQALTMDVISSVGFGMDVDSQHDQDNIFLKKCRQVFKDIIPGSKSRPWFILLIIIATIFPGFNKYCHRLHYYLHKLRLETDARFWLQSEAADIIRQRKLVKYKPHHIDFIQIMLDAETDRVLDNLLEMTKDDVVEAGQWQDIADGREQDGGKSPTVVPGHQRKAYAKKLTLPEMTSNSELFLLAGYETTSTALVYAAYELALNPAVQRQLQEEIDQTLGPTKNPDYNVKNLEYLDMVVSEVLRKHPIAPVVLGRTCLEEVTVNGVHIEKDVTVMADIETIHNDPEQWGPTNPADFCPDRFLPKARVSRHPMAYLPFGAGPRNCIGMRFGLLELKLALTRILQKYNINRCDETEVPLRKIEVATICPKNGVTITLTTRDSYFN